MTDEKNSKSEPQEQQPKNERRFDPELLKKGLQCDLDQYDMLIRCWTNKDITEWNEWRKNNPDEEIWLQGAKLMIAKLQKANLSNANLQVSNLIRANLQGVDLSNANLQRAGLGLANLQGANLFKANLQRADVYEANLQGAYLLGANLQGAGLYNTKLEGANFWGTGLQGAKLAGAIMNGSTFFVNCKIDKDTDFRDTGLENVSIESGTKILLKYNVRRINWQEWYKEHPKLKWVVKAFWSISDYGISTKKIINTFFSLAVIFAGIYFVWGAFDYFLVGNEATPGIVSHLFVNTELENQVHPIYYSFMVFFRAIYFSVVTMTTLGFGDMYANAGNGWLAWIVGHLLLILQVILGYVLLGALVTRLAVLFTSDGPAGRFTPMDEETKQFLAKLKKDKDN